MKIIHTADWHLGQILKNNNRVYEHKHFFSFLKDYIAKEKIDALLIAGDVFHTYMPANSVESLFSNYIKDLRKENPKIQIVVIAGNHDGAYKFDNMGNYCSLGEGVYIIGSVGKAFSDSGTDDEIDFDKLIIPLKDSADEIKAYVAAVPFERSLRRYAQALGIPSSEKDEYTENQLLKLLYQKLYAEIALRNTSKVPVIAMGHNNFLGSNWSNGVKATNEDLVIGGEVSLDPEGMKGADYIALGHIHKAQYVTDNCYYSGSPIPITFAEKDYKHEFSVLDVTENGIERKSVYIDRAVEMISIPPKGSISKDGVLNALDNLTKKNYKPEARPFLSICVHLDSDESENVYTTKQIIRERICEKLKTLEPYFRMCNFQFDVDYAMTLGNTKAGTDVALQNMDALDFLKLFLESKHKINVLDEKLEETYKLAIEEIRSRDDAEERKIMMSKEE